MLWQRLALSVTSLLFLLAESESLTAWPGPGLSLNLPLMPPHTIVRCPGCSRGFATEKGLNNHRAQPSHRHLPCFLRPDLGARISSWGGPGGRVETVDLESTYGMGGDRSLSPDPGDDLDTPEDFNEDDLGGPPIRLSGSWHVLVCMYKYWYVFMGSVVFPKYKNVCIGWYQYVFGRICTYCNIGGRYCFVLVCNMYVPIGICMY